jgi:hypothetical protein
MLHQDGSRYEWLEGRPELDLIATLDDATSEMYSAFLPSFQKRPGFALFSSSFAAASSRIFSCASYALRTRSARLQAIALRGAQPRGARTEKAIPDRVVGVQRPCNGGATTCNAYGCNVQRPSIGRCTPGSPPVQRLVQRPGRCTLQAANMCGKCFLALTDGCPLSSGSGTGFGLTPLGRCRSFQ